MHQKNFLEIRFPTDISYGTSGGPEFSTDIITNVGGHEIRNINWQNARNYFNVNTGIKTQIHLTQLLSFFRICQGQAYGFRFKDWADYQAHKQPLKKIADNKYQLIKEYIIGENKSIRIIKKPVLDTVKIYLDDVVVTDYQIDYTTGIVTFDTELETEKITADFEFDLPVRFDSDKLRTEVDNYGTYITNNLGIIEIKL